MRKSIRPPLHQSGFLHFRDCICCRSHGNLYWHILGCPWLWAYPHHSLYPRPGVVEGREGICHLFPPIFRSESWSSGRSTISNKERVTAPPGSSFCPSGPVSGNGERQVSLITSLALQRSYHFIGLLCSLHFPYENKTKAKEKVICRPILSQLISYPSRAL